MPSIHFSILKLTIGAPGSGKTTWVKEYKKTHPLTYIISTDEIRKELTGTSGCDPSQSSMIHDVARKRVQEILDDPANYGENQGMGPEILVDSTNDEIEEWLKYKELKPSAMVAIVFKIDIEEAMKRQFIRGRIVPRDVVERKWRNIEKNLKYLPCFFNMIEMIDTSSAPSFSQLV